MSAQDYVLWLCDEIDAHATELALESLDCFPRELRAWRLSRREPFPIPRERFNGVATEFLRRDAASGVNQQLGFLLENEQLKLRFVHVRATTTVHYASIFAERADVKYRWMRFVAGLSAKRTPPPTVGGRVPFVISQSFLITSTIEQAKRTAWTSVFASSALAFAVLVLFTRSLRIASLATLSIMCVVSTVVGLCHLYGWSLDVFESVCITILVGFSVDCMEPAHCHPKPSANPPLSYC